MVWVLLYYIHNNEQRETKTMKIKAFMIIDEIHDLYWSGGEFVKPNTAYTSPELFGSLEMANKQLMRLEHYVFMSWVCAEVVEVEISVQ